MTDEEKKKKLHKILDLVLEINEMLRHTERKIEDCFACFEYTGIVDAVELRIFDKELKIKHSETIYFDHSDCEVKLEKMQALLENLKGKTEVDKNGTDGLSDH